MIRNHTECHTVKQIEALKEGTTDMAKTARYAVYTKHRRDKKASSSGFYTDDLERAKANADRAKASWWGVNGIYEWVKVKDTETNKYVYEA